MQDELQNQLIQRLTNDGGQLAPEPRTVPPASPAFREDPRRFWSEKLGQLIGNPNPIENLLTGVPLAGAAGIESILNKIKPRMVGQDVNLPNMGKIDPRIVQSLFGKK